MILACTNISKSFGTIPVLDKVSFHINEYEKAAVVGINGAGKSTLFKIIMKELPADEGEVILAKGVKVGYLSQHQELLVGGTVYDEVLSVKSDIIDMEKTLRKLEVDMKEASEDELSRLLNSYQRLMHEFEQKNGYAYKSEVIGVLKGLGFSEDEFKKLVSALSGGEKTRTALCKLLLSAPDILLLDEPTNHLDIESIAWLETFLLNYKGAVIVISHDRYFINKIASKIVELDNTKAQTFEGNYSEYATKKEHQRETLIKHYYNQQKEIKHHEEVIAKLRSFNREKSIKRAESREKMLDKIERVEKPNAPVKGMHILLEPSILSGNDVLTIKGLSKAYGEQHLFSNIDVDIKRGEKAAIIGNNGTGKTTILKIINQAVKADTGEIKLGAKVHIGYYDQEHHVLDMNKTLFDEISDTYPDMDNTAIRNTLAAFLFTGDDVFKLVKDLSGGERGRVSLAKLMLSEANFLILDEPTNHLDVMSKEILENALNAYTGTVLYVSHDRYFINKTATRILDLKNQMLLNYLGSYDYYLEKKADVESSYFNRLKDYESDRTAASGLQAESDGKFNWKTQKEEQARLRKKQNDLKKVEDDIIKLEKGIEEINQLLTLKENYTDPDKLIEISRNKDELEAKLLEAMEKWEMLV